ncbi:MAG: VOC family protein [Anaerolineae bacterium]|nr:VOC family protein [Anaerolineae bacterium]
MTQASTWPERLPVVQVRLARPTRNLSAIRRFYCVGLGLPELGGFQSHGGYSGVIIGLPGMGYHLEFTEKEADAPLPPPHTDDLLVLYIPNREAIGRLVVKLGAMGYRPVPPDNPYWQNKSVTVPDPDGRRVVLAETEGLR